MTGIAETGTRVELKNLVDGRWQGGSGREIASINPSRPASVVGVGALAARREVDRAVAAATRASSRDAFALANDSADGLSTAVFTNNLARASESVDEINVGILHVNFETAGADPHVPFGGAKGSGYGPKEQGRASREFFTHTATVYLQGGSSL